MAVQRMRLPREIVNPATILSVEQIREEKYNVYTFAFQTPFEAVQWCVRRRLLHNSVICGECNIAKSLLKDKVPDGIIWRCKICRKKSSIRKDSFFFKSKLKLKQILLIILGWARELTHDIICADADLGMKARHTCVEWFKTCRYVCEQSFIDSPIIIGGLNEDLTSKTVEIGESKCFHQKYHMDKLANGNCVFGGIERETNKCFMVEVVDRSAETLSAIIREYILPGSIIVASGGLANTDFKNIAGSIYDDYEITNAGNLVDINDRVGHTQKVRNLWMRMKRKMQQKFGTSEILFASLLQEFIWRNQHQKEKILTEFLICLIQQYPL